MKKATLLIFSAVLVLMQTGTAFAASDGYVVKDQSGEVLFYDLKDLKASLNSSLVSGAASEKAKLWVNFGNAKKTGAVIALHDDKNGFIDYAAIKKALLESVKNGTTFSVDGYTTGSEAQKASGIPSLIKKVELQNGTISYSDYSSEVTDDFRVIGIE